MAPVSFLLASLLVGCLGGGPSQATAQLSPSLGLSMEHFNTNGISIGFLPAWGESKGANTASSLNAILPAPMAVVGAYAQIRASDPNITQIDPYITDLVRSAGPNLPVFALALMPADGLDSVTPEVAQTIASRMNELNSMGITVWLRYAHEMNGDWYAWGQQPQAFIDSWNMVASIVKNGTTDTYMLWSPNEMYAYDNSTATIQGGYEPYWPGADNVDIVGLSFYHYGGWERLNILEDPNEATSVISRFYDLFAAPYNKHFVLSETGAAYTRDADTGVPAPGGASEEMIKMTWIEEISGMGLISRFPLYKALCWFEVIKDENAGLGTIVKEEDFRLLTSTSNITQAAVALMSQNSVDPVTAGAIVGAGADASNGTSDAGIASAAGTGKGSPRSSVSFSMVPASSVYLLAAFACLMI